MSKYDMHMETDPATIPGKILEQIKPGSHVLELGCATGRMTRYLSQEHDCQVSIIEIDEEAYQTARKFAVDGICTTLEDTTWLDYFGTTQFDVILIADVLEHLRNAEEVLAATRQLLKLDGKVLLSLPNIGHHDILANLYQNRFDYTRIGLLDNTHIHFWGKNNLTALATNSGYGIRILDGVTAPPYSTEQNVSTDLPDSVKINFERREYGTIYQFFLVLQKQEWMSQHNLKTDIRLPDNKDNLCSYLYWDTGSGYQANQYVQVIPERLSNNKLRFYSELPFGCQKIRFDPTLNYMCMVSDMHITTNTGSCSYSPLNGVQIGSVSVFSNKNPQIEIPLSNNTLWIEIIASIQLCTGFDFSEVLSAVQKIPQLETGTLHYSNQIAALNESLQHQINLLEIEKQKVSQLQGQITELEAQHSQEQQYYEQYAQQNRILEQCSADLEAEKNTVSKIREQLATCEKQIITYQNQAETYETLLSEHSKRITAYEAQLVDRRAQAAAYEAQLANDRAQAAAYETQLADHRTQAAAYETQLADHRAQAAAYEAQLADHRAQAAAYETQLADHRAQAAAYEAQLADHRAQAAAYEAQLAEHRTQQELSAQHIQNLTVQIQDMTAHIHNLNIQNQQLSFQFNCVLNSRSWKITTPLRSIMQVVKNNRLGSLAYRFLKSLRHCGVKATSIKLVNKLREKRLLPQKSLHKADDISFRGFVKCARSNGAQIFLPEVIEGYAKKKKQRKILFISHEMDLTGAPIVLRNFAMSVMNQGDLPIIASPRPGNLSKNVAENNIPVIVFDGIYSTDFVRRFAPLFDLIVVNTIVGSPVIDMMAETSTPVLWWVHEAEDSYYKEMLERLPTIQPSNVSIYCVGSYAEKVLLSHRPNFRTEHLLYHTLDSVSTTHTESPIKKDDRILFVMVGTMQGRKGPDILADAILQMPEHLVHKSRFLFIGRPVDEYVLQRMDAACKQYPNNVEYLGEMPNQKLLALYKDVDCLICPSRDDPMPCTITEVLLNSIPVICSENTGYAPILRKMGSGKVFNNNDPAELAKHLCSIVENPSSLKEMSELARQTYEDYFSEKVFEVNSQKAISDTLAMRQNPRKKSVSVVIPAYNAGEEGRRLFELLRNQENLDELDIIVVDSGSTDDTVEIARQYGCKVIQIPNEEFSHSYARNLGAQHAVTDYILFMTQDAVPIDKDWISRMITALQENNAVAASCREIPRPECDLYGQVCGFVHNSFMEIIDHDRVMEKPNPWTFESSRKNGQLNDVACLVKRNVFERYQYRGNYAEDLDLGLRLISDNYRLMLMATTPVMHSHTRPAMYHFRRAIVDVAALKRIMPEQPVRETHADQAYNRILTAAVMTFHTLRVLMERVQVPMEPAQLRELLWSIYAEAESAVKSINKDMVAASIAQGLPYKEDGGMLKLMEEILSAAPCVAFDSTNFLDIGAFIVDQTLSYIEHLGLCISEKEILDICDTMIKRFGQIVGIVFAEYSMTDGRKDDSLDHMIQKYSQGI